MTPAEVAQYQADQTVAAAAAATQTTQATNLSTIQQTLTNRLAQIRTARAAIAAGTLFASLTVNEKAVIDGLLADDIYIARLVLEQFDATT